MKGKKTGGRVKGTPNKTTAAGKEAITALLTEYQNSGMMSVDFAALDPEKRLYIAERLMQYIMPKMQSVQAEVENTVIDATLAETLNKLANEE